MVVRSGTQVIHALFFLKKNNKSMSCVKSPTKEPSLKKQLFVSQWTRFLKETKHDIKHHQVISSNWTCMWTKAHVLICFVSDTSSNTFVHYQVDVGVIQPQSAQISRGFPETSATSWGPRSCEVAMIRISSNLCATKSVWRSLVFCCFGFSKRSFTHPADLWNSVLSPKTCLLQVETKKLVESSKSLGIQSPCQRMIGVCNHLHNAGRI